jgi:hypothetical protein
LIICVLLHLLVFIQLYVHNFFWHWLKLLIYIFFHLVLWNLLLLRFNCFNIMALEPFHVLFEKLIVKINLL